MATIGTHFILGFQGPTVPAWLKDYAQTFGLYGVILFDYDYQNKSYDNNIQSAAQLKSLCEEIHSLPGRPQIFIDQEGGKVRRLKESKGFKALASAQNFAGMAADEKKAQALAAFNEMKALGIDWNLAPVVDLNLNPKNPDIGAVERSFGNTSATVTENWKIFNEVAKKSGVKLCLKHFPGLGGATVNSHHELTVLNDSDVPEEQIRLFTDLAPETYGNAILVSHGVYKKMNGVFPSSMSREVLDILRKGKTKNTILISDDLQMQGLLKIMDLKTACTQGLHAGLDLLIIGNNLLRTSKDELFHLSETLATEIQGNNALATRLKNSASRLKNT